ncbi:response regulator [Mucilaginibacter gotjawali]|uniref:CheY-like chemotaxis protein n=2 Tax=Mucilaginibacter gotjawali TaxID=1550579 RepID=A0A839SDN3_9SPHI|nr:response regulator [Mucilaginibacter gotjawali]MBB3056365.1 CheY-like chemotaxis protein [Mucilaginibacter gotjawali]BAU55070.1 Transcriptional regulatory protein AfsQ1 [Mucilaginibacter gotjawali]
MKNNILLVEENDEIRANITKSLSIEGYDVIEADCGAKAVLLTSRELPSLIVCDVLMQCMDGYAVFLSLFTTIYFHKIPFIFFTVDSNTKSADVLSIENYPSRRFLEPGLLNYVKKIIPVDNRIAS